MKKGYSSKMPNSGGSGNTAPKQGGTNQGASSGLKKENPQRSDVTATPSNRNPYPNGIS